VVSKNPIHPRKPRFLAINRYIENTSVAMPNLKVGCLSRSQKKWSPRKVGLEKSNLCFTKSPNRSNGYKKAIHAQSNILNSVQMTAKRN
jgi:hypothetical protein